MTVLLILQCDRSLDCSIRLDPYTLALVITCELSGHKKVRSILMADVKQILHTKQQLRRVESRAKIESVDRYGMVALLTQLRCSSSGKDWELHSTLLPKCRGQAVFRSCIARSLAALTGLLLTGRKNDAKNFKDLSVRILSRHRQHPKINYIHFFDVLLF